MAPADTPRHSKRATLSSRDPRTVSTISTPASTARKSPNSLTASEVQRMPICAAPRRDQVRSSAPVVSPCAVHTTALMAPTESPTTIAGLRPARSRTSSTPTW